MTGLLLVLALASQPAHKADNICLRAVVYKESGNQPIRGIAATRQVILNRARKRGKSVCATVREKGQFSSVKKGMKLSKVKIPKKWLTRYKIASRMHVVPACTTYFHTVSTHPKWANERKFVKVVKDHKFYC